MTANQNFSYSYQNQVRDLVPTFSAMMALAPVLLSLVPIAPYPAKNHKHEWLDDKLSPKQTTLAGAALAGDATITVADGSIFKIGDLWVNTDTDERVLVTGVAGTTITVTRGLGSAAAAMANGSTVRLVTRPQDEGTDPGQDKGHEPTPVYNYTQILDRTALVTRSALNTAMYGIDDLMDREVKLQLDDVIRELNMSTMYGVKQQRTGTGAAQKGRMGGLFEFLDQAGANKIDAAGATLTKTHLNDALEQAFLDGAGKLAAICGTNQARKITALDSNYWIVREDMTAGKQIMEYRGDIANSKNTPSIIVVDPTYSKKRIDFVDLSRLSLVWLANSTLKDSDATPPGADYAARRILGEVTLEVRNAKEAHCSVQNLAP